VRKLVLSVIIAITFVARSVAAEETASPTDEAVCGAAPVQDTAICHKQKTQETITTVETIQIGPNGRTATRVVTATKRYVPYNRLGTGPDGQPCATTGYVEENTTPADERLLIDPNPRETNIPTYGSDLRILENYPPCPLQPVAPNQPAPVETRSMAAARVWEQVPLPKPGPRIAPGRAITGKLAYLETQGVTSYPYSTVTTFGPLTISATGTYTIDWGDGTKSGPHSFEGAPWPEGKITHQYTKVGTYNVVVTEKWTANWSLDGESGTLRTLQTSGRIDNFPVEQIQAVIGR
jgi:hypothetical protein